MPKAVSGNADTDMDTTQLIVYDANSLTIKSWGQVVRREQLHQSAPDRGANHVTDS